MAKQVKQKADSEFIKAFQYVTENGWTIENTLHQSGFGANRLSVIKSKLIKDGQLVKEKSVKYDMTFPEVLQDSVKSIYKWLKDKEP
jgi:hypothetical protein